MKLISYLSALFFSTLVFAQDITISGKITDAQSEENLPFTTISLIEKKSEKLVSGTVSDGEGRFEISGELKGRYTLKVSFVGFEDHTEEILIGELNTNFDVGTIQLISSAEAIDEVTVKGKKSTISAGMESKSFAMDDNIAQSGGSVLDAMKGMPGVTVDQEGKIILRGSDKVMVLMDGKQSSLTGFGNQKSLDNIPVANIERIDIINNPSAKYDATGMAGIINIIYKEETETGFNGDVSFTSGLGAVSKRKEDLPTELGSFSSNPSGVLGLNLNYKKDKVNFFLQSEAMLLKKLPNNEFTTRTYDNGTTTISQVPENRSQHRFILKGGMDYNFDEDNTLTVSGMYDWEHHIDTAQVPYIDVSTGERYRYIAWNEDEITGYMNYSANFNHKFAQKGHEIDFTAQYTKGWEDETYYLNDSSAVRIGRDVTNILATEHTTSVQADYVKPMSSGRMELGAKARFRNLPVEFKVDRGENSVIYPGVGEWSDWGENIYAAYGNFILEKNKYDIEAGMRLEHTSVFYNIDPNNIYYGGKDDKYDYLELFPNLRFSYKLDDYNKISLFYNRRIDRPGEPELRVFPKSDDQELLKIGNPYLRPQFTQSYEVAYKTSWELGSVYVSGYHRFIQNPYMRVYTKDEMNPIYDVIIKSYANTGSATNTGVELVFSQQVLEFWKLSGNGNLYNNSIAAYQGTLYFPYEHTFNVEASSEYTWDAKLNNQFEFENDLSFQLTAIYMADKNIPQGKQFSRASIDIGAKKKIWEGKGEINFAATDIFNTYGIKQNIKGDGFTAVYENYYQTQVFRLGLKYKF
ncbi:outer membrane beta-barrel family protein, partial [Flavicella sp.]|uniref:outer membrane beta-barrel family protein n=1 Tax=Flavicella sp. TaxID=2957742 RepID=UPI00262D736B